MIYLALGTNLGNRFLNLRTAISRLTEFFNSRMTSLVLETAAILPPSAPDNWDRPYLNMIITGNSQLDPFSLLKHIKNLEKQMGRDVNAPPWSPRIIDIDIIDYDSKRIDTEKLSIPHREIRNRDFLQYLLESVEYKISPDQKLDTINYNALNYFTLNPKFVGIVNVTPDSFSDGGKYFDSTNAIGRIKELYDEGASVIELGAQSTRPGYVEIPPSEEIARLDKILERIENMDMIGVDTYFDDVIKYLIKKYDIKWINDVKSQLNIDTIKMIADNNAKLVVMLHGMNISWLKNQTGYLQNLGIKKENILLDPGIGFAKSKRENIEIIKNISQIKDMGHEILFAHSRKTFISSFSNTLTENRDIETIAISDFAAMKKIDYLRVHNVRDHMRFFVAKQQICGQLYNQ
ncbi:MAG: dihydropteroate synthase [Holosporaceae bacterium]|nr:dihydropteroate synthase [Holosporaceae bacterium]